jgi:predicted NBD/HSP70 family sugar kinase
MTTTRLPRSVSAARPQMLRALNERSALELVRRAGPISRAELARVSGLSKPTVSLTLANLERAGLVRKAGQRTGLPGPAAVLYEVRPDAGYVLALDVGWEYLRGAVADLAGTVLAKDSVRARSSSSPGRVGELDELATALLVTADVKRDDLTQTVVGSPGVYDPGRDALALTGRLRGWDRPGLMAGLRERLGAALAMENDVDAAAVAELAHGHGREHDTFAFVSVGTGVGMGLVVDGRLHRGAHGAAGEIGYLPLGEGPGADRDDARRRGSLEATASGAAVVRAARRAGMGGALTARKVFAAAADGDERAAAVVGEETRLVAQVLAAVVAVVDPPLVVLGGGIGQAPGFAEAVAAQLRTLAPVVPRVLPSALGSDVVVQGCLTAALDLAWERVVDGLATDRS